MARKFLLFLSVVAIILSSCSKKQNQFTISGTITHAEGDTIYLDKLHTSSVRPVDKVRISKKGEFEFVGETSIPTFYLLKLSDDNYITLLVDSLTSITLPISR